jgi:signal transduction histidine kinase
MVHAYTQLLLRRYVPDDAQAKQFARYIHTGVERMEALINDLLAYSRTIHSDDDVTPVCDLNTALLKALEMLDESIRTTQAVITHDKLPFAIGDEGQLAQVFQNLLSNSLKYRQRDRAPVVHIQATSRDFGWSISVTDNGIGFDPKYAERIFGLFRRLHKDEYPGTGLGLAICHRIIERYGGRIWAESIPGSGSVFTFTVRQALPGECPAGLKPSSLQ